MLYIGVMILQFHFTQTHTKTQLPFMRPLMHARNWNIANFWQGVMIRKAIQFWFSFLLCASSCTIKNYCFDFLKREKKLSQLHRWVIAYNISVSACVCVCVCLIDRKVSFKVKCQGWSKQSTAQQWHVSYSIYYHNVMLKKHQSSQKGQ